MEGGRTASDMLIGRMRLMCTRIKPWNVLLSCCCGNKSKQFLRQLAHRNHELLMTHKLGETRIESIQIVGPTDHLLGVAYLHVGVAYLPVT